MLLFLFSNELSGAQGFPRNCRSSGLCPRSRFTSSCSGQVPHMMFSLRVLSPHWGLLPRMLGHRCPFQSLTPGNFTQFPYLPAPGQNLSAYLASWVPCAVPWYTGPPGPFFERFRSGGVVRNSICLLLSRVSRIPVGSHGSALVATFGPTGSGFCVFMPCPLISVVGPAHCSLNYRGAHSRYFRSSHVPLLVGFRGPYCWGPIPQLVSRKVRGPPTRVHHP
ncbi:hypothetical protein CSUI_007876 [Cystoisospora suis]|uniref:Uncharacterized protein n=1 Tax=Cystoisospora suis TaxID=483139 RepID=A0A2C6KMD0_9APIC|nr:hypothetical protein CSUI_007876 [Cystoisospora suis]